MKSRRKGTKKNKRTRKKRGSGGCLSCFKKKSHKDEVATPPEIKPFMTRPTSTIRIPRRTSSTNLSRQDTLQTIRRRTPSPSSFDDPKTMAHDNVDFAAIGFEEHLKKLPPHTGGHKKKTRKMRGGDFDDVEDFIRWMGKALQYPSRNEFNIWKNNESENTELDSITYNDNGEWKPVSSETIWSFDGGNPCGDHDDWGSSINFNDDNSPIPECDEDDIYFDGVIWKEGNDDPLEINNPNEPNENQEVTFKWNDIKSGKYKIRKSPTAANPNPPWYRFNINEEEPEYSGDELVGGKRRKKKTRKYKGDKYPYKNITKKEAIADFIKLKTTTNPRSLNGLEIVNYGTEKLRVRTKYRGKSLIERWKDKKARKTLKKFANRLYKGSYTDDLLHAYRSAIALSWGTLSSMRTSAALQMYRKYNAKKVLDFTAGWGSRMTAALAADIDYIGIDTNKSLKKGYNKILKATKKHTKSKVKLFFQPAETVNYSKLDYDFVFTSPPYEYLELYEHMKNYEGTKKIKQAYSANDTKRKNDGFYDTFLIPTIKEIYKHLPKGKWMCLNVPDLMYDKIKKKWKACDKKDDYMISKRVGSTMKAEDRRGQEFVYCWKKK